MSGLNGQNWEAKKGVKSHEIAKNTYVQFLLSSVSNTSLRILHKNTTLNHFCFYQIIISQLSSIICTLYILNLEAGAYKVIHVHITEPS